MTALQRVMTRPGIAQFPRTGLQVTAAPGFIDCSCGTRCRRLRFGRDLTTLVHHLDRSLEGGRRLWSAAGTRTNTTRCGSGTRSALGLGAFLPDFLGESMRGGPRFPGVVVGSELVGSLDGGDGGAGDILQGVPVQPPLNGVAPHGGRPRHSVSVSSLQFVLLKSVGAGLPQWFSY